MKQKLWTKNFTLLIAATTMGAAGGIMGSFALSFLVYDETHSTLASALILAIQLVPYFVLPLFIAPLMDRLPRKPFLVGGDFMNGVLYALAGFYLLKCEFSYTGYLAFSLLLATLGSLDALAYDSIYPKLIPKGLEQKGYAVSATLYPVLKVLLTPLAAVAMDALGVGLLLLIQAGLSFLAALTESFIRIQEQRRTDAKLFSIKTWWGDIKEAAGYLRRERGLRNMFAYLAVTNGVGMGYSPILVAFFRTAAGFTAAMYSLFSVAEFLGRTIGGAVQYRLKLAKEKKFGFIFMVYQVYDFMDMCLLWMPYPLMLANRGICGFLGANSATMRQAAVQSYIPEKMRARINAFQEMLMMAVGSAFSLVIGMLGEVLEYRWCMSACAALAMLVCWLTIWRRRKDVRKVYESEPAEQPA